MNKKVCGAQLRGKKKGVTCRKTPMANGKCRLHGGATPSGPENKNFKHGRYAEAFKGKIAERFANASADDKPLDLLPELAVTRTMLESYGEKISRKKSVGASDVKNVSALALDVVKIASTIAKVRNDEALTIAELMFIKKGMMMLMEKYVPDPDHRRNFIADLSALIPERIATKSEERDGLPVGAGEAG